jgi:hypothetical protein
MIEGRVVLEKIKVLESRMRYQIEKLVRVAEEVPSGKDVAEGVFFYTATTTPCRYALQIPSPSVQILKTSSTTSRTPTRTVMPV